MVWHRSEVQGSKVHVPLNKTLGSQLIAISLVHDNDELWSREEASEWLTSPRFQCIYDATSFKNRFMRCPSCCVCDPNFCVSYSYFLEKHKYRKQTQKSGTQAQCIPNIWVTLPIFWVTKKLFLFKQAFCSQNQPLSNVADFEGKMPI